MAGITGALAVITAIFFFGSNFIPVKKFDYGDGLFFQWVMCVGIWLVGIVVNLVRDAPQFEPYAMVGGVMWCTGNLATVPIIRRIGMALGLLIWGGWNLVTGWASGIFGFLGVEKQTDEIENWGLNITGVVFALIALAISSQIRPESTPPPEVSSHVQVDKYDSIPQTPSPDHSSEEHTTVELGEEPIPAVIPVSSTSRQTSLRARMEGILMSVGAGILYGMSFNPAQSLIDKDDGEHSTVQADYVFSHFCGIMLCSTVYFLVYLGYKWYQKESPAVNQEGILPAIISGVMWAIAQTAFFIANGELKFVVTFPLISVGPGFLGCLYGLFLFKEIKGRRNYIILGICGICIFICALCIVLSRK